MRRLAWKSNGSAKVRTVLQRNSRAEDCTERHRNRIETRRHCMEQISHEGQGQRVAVIGKGEAWRGESANRDGNAKR